MIIKMSQEYGFFSNLFNMHPPNDGAPCKSKKNASLLTWASTHPIYILYARVQRQSLNLCCFEWLFLFFYRWHTDLYMYISCIHIYNMCKSYAVWIIYAKLLEAIINISLIINCELWHPLLSGRINLFSTFKLLIL